MLVRRAPLYELSIRYSSNELRWGKHSISASSSRAFSQVVALVHAMPFISQRIKGGWSASGLAPFSQFASCFQYVSLPIFGLSISLTYGNCILWRPFKTFAVIQDSVFTKYPTDHPRCLLDRRRYTRSMQARAWQT